MASVDVAALKELFRSAPFVANLGLQLESCGSGECVTTLKVEQRHLQQHGLVHAGVQATMADHTAGAAASTLAPAGFVVVTAEIKISLLRAAKGEQLLCKSKVLKPGKRLSFVESEVFCIASGKEYLAAKATATMAIIAAGGE